MTHPAHRGALLAGALLVAALGCSQPTRTDTEPDTAGATPATRPDPPASGERVLARARGRDGAEIRVEEAGGRRLLYIGDTLHAAVPWAGDGPDPAATDPLVDLIHAVRPEARTALVIGLGSGRTAGDLARLGLQVTAVEIEPAVIELAREHFGYRGEAIAADGLEYLRGHEGRFDIILMDAFSHGAEPPAQLVSQEALSLMRRSTAAGGITALRLHAAPGAELVTGVRRMLGRTRAGAHYDQLFGSGLGGERQNLYLLASDRPISAASARGLPLWPLAADELALGAVTGPAGEPSGDGRTIGREVTLVGYVHRMPGGGLALDLPHQEMGAVRYLLVGAAIDRLSRARPADARFPTRGDIASDGDTRRTLRPLLGGGGAKRSDLRFSPLVAAVTGRARLLALVHPDAASRIPASVRGESVTDERIPWGGALYQLDVAEVHWQLDQDGWLELAPRLAPHVTAAAAALDTGDLAAASAALAAYRAELAGALGAHGELVPLHRAVGTWQAGLEADARRAADQGGTPFARAAACDRALHRLGPAGELGPGEALAAALHRCAVGGYEEVVAAAAGDAYTHDASARLLVLLDPDRAGVAMSPAEARRARQRLLQIRKTFRGSPMHFPPGSVE